MTKDEEDKSAWRWHPDNLVKGNKYRFTYKSAKGETFRLTGFFSKMDVQQDILWLFFETQTSIGKPYACVIDVTSIITMAMVR